MNKTTFFLKKTTQDLSSVSLLSVAAPSIVQPILDFRAPELVQSVVQGLRRNCPQDFACITGAVKSSEATSGNIAFIVELLKNISADLSDNVTGEKMKVGNLCEKPTIISPPNFALSQFQIFFSG